MQSVPERPVALYCRVSTEDQAERQTIHAQLDFLRRFCHLYGLVIAGEYLDDGISGTTPLDERPEGRRLLQDARDGRFGTVLLYRTDRLARKLTVLLAAYETLEQAGVGVRSATEPLDTTTPIGKFVFQLLGSLAELERATITERMTLGRDRVVRQGQWIVGCVPYGYDLDADRRLVPSHRLTSLGITEADVVRQVVERIAAGSTLVAEARRLTLAGVPAVMRYANGHERVNPRGWQQSRLGDMLRNEGYVSGAFMVQSRNGPVRVEAPPLISPALWQQARARLALNKALATRADARPYLLRGLIRCGQCGHRFVGHVIHRRGRVWRYYRCGGALPSVESVPERRCRAPVVAANWLEEAVWQDIRQFILDPGPALAEAQRQVRERLGRTGTLEAEHQRLLRRLAELDRGRETLLELVRRGRVTLAEAEAQLDAVAAERAQVQAELDALRAQTDLASALEAQVADAARLLALLRERLAAIEAGGPAAKRPWIEQLVSAVTMEWDPQQPPRRRRPTVVVTYVFGAPRVVVCDAKQYKQL